MAMELYFADTYNRREMLANLSIQLLCTGLLSVGFLLGLLSFIQAACPVWLVVLCSLVTVVLCMQFTVVKNGRMIGVLLLALLNLLYFTALRRALANGMIYLWNCAADVLGNNSRILLPQYNTVDENTLQMDLFLVIGYLAVLSGCLMFLLYKAHRWWLLGVPLFIYVAAAAFTKAEINNGYSFLLVVAVLLNLCAALYEKKEYQNMSNRHRMALLGMAAVTGVVCIVAAVCYLVIPASHYQAPAITRWVQQAVADQVEQFRFKKAFVNTLPKGKLTEGGQWKTSQETALLVEMEEPSPLYLKGYVGSVYQVDHWEEIPYSVSYGNQDLFYWLAEDGFSSYTQLSQARSYLEDEALAEEVGEIQITNQNADSEYVYVPYELTEQPQLANAARQMTDGGIHGDSLFGERNYAYASVGNLVKDFPQMAAQMYLAQVENPNLQYTSDESYYNSYAYKQYTALSDTARKLLKQELGAAGEQEDGHIAYASAIEKIRSYLEEKITYTTQAGEFEEGQDFLTWFLSESKMGHSVQYATAATLMFRYYGIPARYVEGYLLTEETAQHGQKGTPMQIPGSCGHAWTEIYVDGLGWVPMEVTPSAYALMPQPDLAKGLQADSTIVATTPQTQQTQTEDEESLNTRQLLVDGLLYLGKLLLILLLVFDLFCLMFLLYVLLKRIFANRKRRKLFEAEDGNAAVRSMISYMYQLLEWKAVVPNIQPEDFKRLLQEYGSEELNRKYRDAWLIGEKAAFSPHKIDSKERALVTDCYKEMLEEIKVSEGWYGRWIMRYIVRLY